MEPDHSRPLTSTACPTRYLTTNRVDMGVRALPLEDIKVQATEVPTQPCLEIARAISLYFVSVSHSSLSCVCKAFSMAAFDTR